MKGDLYGTWKEKNDDELHRLLKIEVAKESTTIAKFVAEAIKEKIERSNKE